MKRLVAVLTVIAILLSFGFSASASEPTSSFVHEETPSGTVVSVASREMYSATRVITANSLGLDKSLSALNDLCCDKAGNVYLLLGDQSVIVVLNKDYTFNRYIKLKSSEGFEESFSRAQGIYVDSDNNLYVCDTQQGRVIISDLNGNVTGYIEEPDSELLPDDFFFMPNRIVRNSRGYIYILSLMCYHGALVYSPEGEFLGFYGSNNVKASALDTLEYLWNRLTQTDTKKSFSIKKNPDTFVDFCLDSKGYMVTCTGKTDADKNATGQIRKLSPGGDDILYKTNFEGISVSSSSYNFVEDKVVKRFGVAKPQNIKSVDVDSDGFIYALDGQLNLIYVYDEECNMICGFGGGADNMERLGVFDSSSSLKVNGTDVLVTDIDNKSVTVFERTEYGKVLAKAQSLYLKGEYELAEPLWEQVLALNGASQLAYRGLAMSRINEKNYDEALYYAKAGLDYSVYDTAWKVIRDKYIADNFWWIFGLFVLIVGGIIAFSVVAKKKNIVLIKNEKVKLAISTPVHPFNVFTDVKYKAKGSVVIALVIMFLYFVARVLESTASGFLFTSIDTSSYNMLYTLIETVGLVLLWSVCNWLVASLFSGNGRFKDVLLATTYSIIPIVIYSFIRTVLSHVLSLSGLSIMDGVYTVVLILTFFILCIGIMTVHEYDFFKFLSTSLVTIFLMILVVFVIFLVGVLLGQVVGFFVSIFQEVFYR